MTNIDINGSFEQPWTDYNESIQIPAGWSCRWADASTPNPYSSDPWNQFVPPEIVHKLRHQLPPEEQDQFILDGDTTLKAFKGHGAFCLEMVYPLILEPGTHTYTTRIFGDLVALYFGGRKHWAADPNSGLLRFVLNGHAYTDTHSITPGMWNVFSMEFAAEGDTEIGVQIMCPFALANSGIFADAWSLVKQSGPDVPVDTYDKFVHLVPQDVTLKEWNDISGKAFRQHRTLTKSAHDAFIKDETVVNHTVHVWAVERVAGTRKKLVQWVKQRYPPVPEIKYRKFVTQEPDPPLPPPPPPPPPRNVIKAGFHLQRPFDGCLDIIKRCADAGKPMAWVKVVQEGLEIIEQIKALSPDTQCMYRYIPRESPAYFMQAADYSVALDQSTFAPMFDRAVELGYDAVETPINEVIGTHNPDIVMQNVSFDSAYCYWCRDRSGDRVAPAILTPGGGNPDHGYETTLLIPAARAAIETNGILVPHTYFPVRPEPGTSEEWMKSGQVQYDYHLRPVLSWMPTFADAGIDVSKLRFVFGECGAVGAHKNAVGLPGGYLDAGAGWRRYDALNADLPRYINLLEWREDLCQLYPQIEGWMIFTQGFVKWGHFQFNREWTPFIDRLLS